jgi:hypothetical protein
MQTVTGNTYPVREQLKAIGGRWNRAAQGWDFADDTQADRARAIVEAAGPAAPRYANSRSRGRSVAYRFSSGATMYQNSRGRCEDAPCCGCCS